MTIDDNDDNDDDYEDKNFKHQRRQFASIKVELQCHLGKRNIKLRTIMAIVLVCLHIHTPTLADE
ncbi:hypothetical protein ACF0H5_020334 [Mactra antiquata]